MKLQDNIDFTALNWVKHELDATLKQGRDALEAYVENPSDVGLMRESALHLHQVQGTLRMVELYGAAMVVEEMERLAHGLLDDTVKQREEAYSVLMRGMVQLPDYLERVQSGHKDIPIVLLPLLNDLRACRGDNLLTESALFAPDLHADLPRTADGSVAALPPGELRTQALRLRLGFQAALLKWFRDESASEHLDRLSSVLERLRAISHGTEPRRLWWIAGGVIEAVRDKGLEASVSVKLLFGGVDREIKRFADGGETVFAATPPRELVKNLLYYIAHSTGQGARAVDVRATYRLDTLLPTQKELQHAQGSMTGHNRNLLDTVSVAIKDDLLRVKEALDIFLRSHDANPADLANQAEILDRVGDTLGMLGLGMPRKVVSEQRVVIEEMSDHRRAIDEGALLDVAGALLYVEASLDDHIERLGAGGESETAEGGELELPKAEVRKILDALMREAAVNIQQAKHDIIAFIESPWEHARVEQIPRLLEEISGALRMLGLGDAAQLMTGIVRFVETELLQHRRVPTAEQMDKLADALAAIEYYLEATREQRGNRERILNVTRESLEALGYWPVPSGGGGPGSSTPSPTPPPESDARPPASAENDALEAAAALAYSVDSTHAAPAETRQRDVSSLSFAPSANEFPSWGDHLPSGRSDGLRDESLDRHASGADLPSIDLPDIDLPGGEWTGQPAPAVATGDAPNDLPSVVEIAPGHDIGDLIVGETVVPEPFAHDLSGLRLAETGESESGWIEIDEEIEEDVPVESTAPDAGFQSSGTEDIDDEIREVFIEEVQEEIDNMQRQLPVWKADLQDLEQLKPLRRSFHTLKGSGRLVGAMTLGEFSWKVENMLNRVLDRTVAPSSSAVALVEHAIEALPELLAALRGGSAPVANIHGIMTTADRIAAGEEAQVPARPASRKMRRTVRRRVPVAAASNDNATSGMDIESAFAAPSPEVQAGPLPNIDPVLFDILKSEVAGHLAVIGDYLDACDPQPIVASETLLRAVHTLNGAIAMVDIPSLGHTLAPLEGYIKRLRGIGAAPDAEGMSALHGTVALAREVVERLDIGMGEMPDSSDLVQRIVALREALPEPETSLHLYTGTEAVPPDAKEETPAAPVDEDIARHHSTPAVADEDLTSSFVQAFEHDEAHEFDFVTAEIPADLAASLTAFDRDDLAMSDAKRAAPPDAIENDADEAAFSGLPTFVDATQAQAPEEAGTHASDGSDEYGHAQEIPAVAFDAEDVESAQLDRALLGASKHDDAVANAFVADDELSFADDPIADGPPAREANTSKSSMTRNAAAESTPKSALTGAEAPPIAEDLQPDGPLELPDMDDDLLGIFVQEGADILDHSDSLMAGLRETPSDRDLVVGLQRDLHTLKGGARMAGLAPIGDLSHAMESLIDIVSEGRRPMDRVTVESLERGFDRLHGLVQRVAQRQAIAMPLNAIARFEGLVAGEIPEFIPATETETPIESAIESPVQAQAEEIVAASEPETAAPIADAEPEIESSAAAAPRAPRPAPRHLPTFEDEQSPRVPQEMIRVRSELLDSLVNYAGEVSIYRSRLEQQISTFRFNLIEFEQTVSRLREQLRKLEIETEAQIIARYQREHHEPGQTTFDPLELDRFSQLQQLSRALGESVSDLVSIQGLLDDLTRQSETLLLQQSRVSSDLQEGLMRTRMVPFDSLVPNLRRTLRQAAQELGKRAQLRVDGAQGEMDRNLLERMKAPFEHMLRNALAHGIESPEERLASGKPSEGTVNIAVSREATEVVLRVSDDGHGMDREAIRKKAIERGLLKPDVELSDRDLYGFVLETGFSTAEQVTQLSGRGVGMDVVHNEIKQLGGSLLIDSQQGKGATFTIRLPFTLAVTQAILVKLGDNTYAIPMSSVQGVVRIARDDLDRRLGSGVPKYSYAGEEFNIYELSQLLGVPPGRAIDETQLPLLMTRTGDQRAAVRIDAVVGSREIVVKSVGPQISSVPGIFGATIMGDGSVVMILDLAPLVRRSAALRASVEAGTVKELPVYAPPAVVQEQRRHPLIMVVDDSITMRKVTTRVLERAELDVITAKDGLDAVEKLQEKVPDLMLLDIEMPRMDGYELATYMRNDSRLKDVPIIMVTSRTGEKHRQRALEIGVERYLGKPYQEADLLRHVQEILRMERA